MSKTPRADLSSFTEAELAQELARRKAEALPDGATLTDMERAVLEMQREVALAYASDRPAIAAMLGRMKPEKPTAKPCPACGKRVPVKERARPRTVESLGGPVTFTRNYHWCRHCRTGFYPVDRLLGLTDDGDLTPEMEARVLDFAVNDVFGHAAERWQMHYGSAISDTLVRRVAARAGRMIAMADADVLQSELVTTEAPPPAGELVIVQTDGSHVPIRGAEPWKEAKLGVVVRTSNYLPRTAGRRGVITRARYAAVVGGQEEFAAQLAACLRAERTIDARVAWVADGAPGNWRLAEELAPHATQILDWYHALEHAMACGRTLLGDADANLALWQTRCEALLAAGDVDATVRELMACGELCTPEQLGSIDDLVRYYRTHQERMHYDRYRDQGMPIGSGIVESAHQHVLQTRMKRTGQRWSLSGARSMAALRAGYRTAGPVRFYRAVMAAHRSSHPPRKPAPARRGGDTFPRVGEQRGRFTRRRASNL
jgi:hypothetical protein